MSNAYAVDTSALVAIVRREPGHESLARMLVEGESLFASPNLVELAMVLHRQLEPEVLAGSMALLQAHNIRVVAFTPDMAERAVEAFLRFGKGRHPACLNFGDCASYALAVTLQRPLVWVGEDFDLTDVRRARPIQS